jgi:hypothetical protein
LAGAADEADIAEESADDMAAVESAGAADADIALLSGAALTVLSVAFAVLLADGEHPATARPATAARTAATVTSGARLAEVFDCGMSCLRLTRPKHPAS